jgi:Rrf2 family protein
MIRISRKADYAVFIMGWLAQRAGAALPEPAPASAQEIAEQTRLSRPLVANLLKDPTRAGLLQSVRGQRGGYLLALPAADITLAQILEAVEGPFTFVDCAHDHRGAPPPAPDRGPDRQHDAHHDCDFSSYCTTRAPMRLLHERIAKMLRETRLTELSGQATMPSLLR